MKRKKVLIDVNSVVPCFALGKMSGISRTTLELVKALSELDDTPVQLALTAQNMKGIGASQLRSGLEEHHLYVPYREFWNKLLSRTPVQRWICGHSLLHIPHNFAYVHRNEPCVVTLHDTIFMKMAEEGAGHEELRRNAPAFLKRCRRIITCSEHSANDIRAMLQEETPPIDVIPWGIRHDIFYPTDNKKAVRDELAWCYGISKPYFVSISCNAGRKRTDALVRAYLELSAERPLHHELVLVWENPPAKLLDEVAESNCAHRIHFLNRVEEADLRLLYQGATAAFTPSSYEGFGLPVAEAMACGTPVVTCRNSSLEKVGGNAAIYIDEPISRSLPLMMKQLDASLVPTAYHRELGLAQANRFRWEYTASKTICSYCNALGIPV